MRQFQNFQITTCNLPQSQLFVKAVLACFPILVDKSSSFTESLINPFNKCLLYFMLLLAHFGKNWPLRYP